MSRTIRERIVNNYDWSIIIEKIENMFKETLTNTT
jgi:glycosyltransferase involved in cell wall biosynthesis